MRLFLIRGPQYRSRIPHPCSQDGSGQPIFPRSWQIWFRTATQCTSRPARRPPSFSSGGRRKNGRRSSTNGCVFTAGPAPHGPGPARGSCSRILLLQIVDVLLTLVVHYQVTSTGHLNTIMTFFEIVEPPVPSPLEGLPLPILRKAIAVLAKSARAQIIAVADGEGVRFLPGAPPR